MSSNTHTSDDHGWDDTCGEKKKKKYGNKPEKISLNKESERERKRGIVVYKFGRLPCSDGTLLSALSQSLSPFHFTLSLPHSLSLIPVGSGGEKCARASKHRQTCHRYYLRIVIIYQKMWPFCHSYLTRHTFFQQFQSIILTFTSYILFTFSSRDGAVSCVRIIVSLKEVWPILQTYINKPHLLL